MITPDLARYVAAGDEGHTDEDTLTTVLAAVAAEFTLVRDPGGESGTESAWLDTFDWRLHKAGLTVEYVAGPHGGELRLTSAAKPSAAKPGAVTAAATDAAAAAAAAPDAAAAAVAVADPLTVQPVTAWQATRSHRPSDLPDGPVTARIAGLIAPRALLPAVVVTSRAARYRLLNSDGKTVAWLLIERLAIRGGDAAPLAPRLAIAEVRGYQSQARHVARLIAAVPGVCDHAEPPLTDALRALGRRPGDYSNKVDTAITAALPAPRAAAAILLRLLDTVEANIGGVLGDTDPEFLHDLRVSVRRTRSALKLFGGVLGLSADELAFFAAEFKWMGDVTTPTRDLDVHLLDFAQMASGLAAAKPDDLEPFRGYLEQRRRREFRGLTRALRSARFTSATHGWRATLTAIEQAHAGGTPGATVRSGKTAAVPPQAGSIGALAAERTRMSFVKVARRGAAITASSAPESLHDLRKRCKELRYALEFFAPLHDPGWFGPVVADLKRLQDCLGDFQDTDVQIREIRTLAAAMLATGEAPAVTLLAMGEVTAGLVVRQRAARAAFERRFAALADMEGQRRMSALLRGRGAGARRYPLCGSTRCTPSRAGSVRPPRRSTWPTWRPRAGCGPCCGTWIRRAPRRSCSG